MPFYYLSFIHCILCVIIMLAVSHLTPPPPEECLEQLKTGKLDPEKVPTQKQTRKAKFWTIAFVIFFVTVIFILS